MLNSIFEFHWLANSCIFYLTSRDIQCLTADVAHTMLSNSLISWDCRSHSIMGAVANIFLRATLGGVLLFMGPV